MEPHSFKRSLSAPDFYDNEIQRAFDEVYNSCFKKECTSPPHNDSTMTGQSKNTTGDTSMQDATNSWSDVENTSEQSHIVVFPQMKNSSMTHILKDVQPVDIILQSEFDKAYAQCQKAATMINCKGKSETLDLTAESARNQSFGQKSLPTGSMGENAQAIVDLTLSAEGASSNELPNDGPYGDQPTIEGSCEEEKHFLKETDDDVGNHVAPKIPPPNADTGLPEKEEVIEERRKSTRPKGVQRSLSPKMLPQSNYRNSVDVSPNWGEDEGPYTVEDSGRLFSGLCVPSTIILPRKSKESLTTKGNGKALKGKRKRQIKAEKGSNKEAKRISHPCHHSKKPKSVECVKTSKTNSRSHDKHGSLTDKQRHKQFEKHKQCRKLKSCDKATDSLEESTIFKTKKVYAVGKSPKTLTQNSKCLKHFKKPAEEHPLLPFSKKSCKVIDGEDKKSCSMDRGHCTNKYTSKTHSFPASLSTLSTLEFKPKQQKGESEFNISRVGLFSESSGGKVARADERLRNLESHGHSNVKTHTGGVWNNIL